MSKNTEDVNTLSLFDEQYYQGGNAVNIKVDSNTETIWITKERIARIFSVDEEVVSNHINNVFSTLELDENEASNTFIEDEKEERLYNLDVIIAVGYRIDSKRATRFRQWAANIIKQYTAKGYALDKERLKKSSSNLEELLKELKELEKLRSDEKYSYKIVIGIFKALSKDYNNNEYARNCYQKLQNIFYKACSGSTSDKIRFRANSEEFKMNAISADGLTKKDMEIAKNYLTKGELDLLKIIGEQFFAFAKSMLSRGKKLTMEEINNKFTEILKVQDYKTLNPNWQPNDDGEGKKHVAKEYEKYKESGKLEEDKLLIENNKNIKK